MIIGGLQKCSLIDFPEMISAIIFTQGCNFRCRYCHNPELLHTVDSTYSLEYVLEFLKTRQGKLDGVVISGGEPTLQQDLKDVILQIRELGFKIKLDTNGTNPEILEELLNEKLLDYVAMDIKAPLEKYFDIVQQDIDTTKIKKSIALLENSNVKHEFRTTVLKSLTSKEDLEQIGSLIEGCEKYYIQKFEPTKIWDETIENDENYTWNEFEQIAESLKKKIKNVGIR